MKSKESGGDISLKMYIKRHSIEFSVFAFMMLLLLIFAINNPQVFLSFGIYRAIFTVFPIALLLSCAVVFVIASGEIDLSFPSTMGVGLWIFAAVSDATGIATLGLILAILSGILIGFLNGVLVTKVKLSALVVTLGMNFLLRGLIMIGTDGRGISLVFLNETFFSNLFTGRILGFPVQMIWGIAFAVLCHFLFKRHRFGAHVCYAGDNMTSARETGVKVDRVKTMAYIIVGIAAAFAGVLVGLINHTFWPTTGDGYLLIIMAAVFLGGTPTWGGVGTIIGAVMGAFILSFLESGIIAIGLTGFFTQFFFGLILVIALVSHKASGMKRKGG